jgi:hypothetical protein
MAAPLTCEVSKSNWQCTNKDVSSPPSTQDSISDTAMQPEDSPPQLANTRPLARDWEMGDGEAQVDSSAESEGPETRSRVKAAEAIAWKASDIFLSFPLRVAFMSRCAIREAARSKFLLQSSCSSLEFKARSRWAMLHDRLFAEVMAKRRQHPMTRRVKENSERFKTLCKASAPR